MRASSPSPLPLLQVIRNMMDQEERARASHHHHHAGLPRIAEGSQTLFTQLATTPRQQTPRTPAPQQAVAGPGSGSYSRQGRRLFMASGSGSPPLGAEGTDFEPVSPFSQTTAADVEFGARTFEELSAVEGPLRRKPTLAAGSLSVRKTLHGCSLLLTGATGYMGSVVLEQLLRTCPGVEKVYVLARGKRGWSAARRVSRVLQSGLFHLVRDQPELLAKVVIVEGDLLSSAPDLGIPNGPIKTELLQGPGKLVVIHNAARISLEDPLPVTLRHNYLGTRALLRLLATAAPGRLAGFVHVSTAFVNTHLPDGATAEERIYDLKYGDQQIDHARVVDEILSMGPDLAEARSRGMCSMFGFPNTYVLGKHLTELLVRDFHGCPAPVAIVRPSLVSALAGAPYPGFVGNLAGPSGYAVAFALGFFVKNAPAWHAHNFLDSIPGDTAASVMLVAAAALVARVHVPSGGDAAGASGYGDLEAALPPLRHAAGAGVKGDAGGPKAAAAPAASGGGPAAPSPAGEDAVASRPTFGFWGAPQPAAPSAPPAAAPEAATAAAAGGGPPKVRTVVRERAPEAPGGAGGGGGDADAAAGTDSGLQVALKTMQARAAATRSKLDMMWGDGNGADHHAAHEEEEEGPLPPLLVLHAASSCLQPLTHMEVYLRAYEIFAKYPPPHRLMLPHPLGRYVKPEPDYEPIRWKTALAQGWVAVKVGLTCALLRCFGQSAPANRLSSGHKMWAQTQDPKNDFKLYFSVRNALYLESLLSNDELADFPLIWRGDWGRFGRTYAAGVARLFLKYDIPSEAGHEHDWVHVDNRKV